MTVSIVSLTFGASLPLCVPWMKFTNSFGTSGSRRRTRPSWYIDPRGGHVFLHSIPVEIMSHSRRLHCILRCVPLTLSSASMVAGRTCTVCTVGTVELVCMASSSSVVSPVAGTSARTVSLTGTLSGSDLLCHIWNTSESSPGMALCIGTVSQNDNTTARAVFLFSVGFMPLSAAFSAESGGLWCFSPLLCLR